MSIKKLQTNNPFQIKEKINELIDSIGTDWKQLLSTDLIIDKQEEYYLLNVSSNKSLVLSRGKPNSYMLIRTIGDGVHTVSFPVDWVSSGDNFDATKIQEISIRYTGFEVRYHIDTIKDADIPDVIAPTFVSGIISSSTASVINLTFSEVISAMSLTISASGGAVTGTNAGLDTTTPSLNLSRAITSGETVTVSGTVEDTDSNILTLSSQAIVNNVVIILLQDDFTGTTLDTGKWVKTNPDSANLTISQNNKTLFTRTTDTLVASTLSNYLESVSTFNSGVANIVFNRDSGFTNSVAGMFLWKDSNNYAWLRKIGTNLLQVRIQLAGVTAYEPAASIADNKRVKIEKDASNIIKFSYWDTTTGAWIQIGTNQTAAIGTGLKIRLSTNSDSADAAGNVFSFDDFYLTDVNYTTQTPS